MATKAQIAERVLQKLMVLENGETMNADDQAIVEAAYDSAYVLLDKRRLVTWGSVDSIPTGAELPIINYVANEIKEAFSIPPTLQQTLFIEAQQAIHSLSILASPEYTYEETTARYY